MHGSDVFIFVIAQLVKKFVSFMIAKFLENALCCLQPGAPKDQFWYFIPFYTHDSQEALLRRSD
jgi:hypothetical protein